MAQVSDVSIANQGFSAFRTELNSILAAFNTSHAGSSAPASLAAGSMWLDTSGGATSHILKFYDGTHHITFATINTTANTVDFSDSSVTVADDSVTLAKMASGTDGNIISYDASGNPVHVATGSAGQVLTSAGAGAPPTFATVSAGTALTGSTNNQVTTVTGANAIAGEAGLIFDGTKLGIGVTPTLALDISSTDPRIYMIDTTNAGSTYKTKFGQYNDTFLISTNNGDNDAIKIYATGEVTTPLNPAFRLYQSTQTTYASGHTMYNQNITEEYDVNADVGSGTFTAPVTGKYLFSMSYYDVTAAENQQYYMEFVTSNRTHRWAQINFYRAGYTGTNGNMKGEGTIIADMDVNDTAYIRCGSSTNVDNGSNAQHSYYSGILIG